MLQDCVYYLLVDDLPSVIVASNELRLRMIADGRPKAADMIAEAYATFERELETLGREMAVYGTEVLREKEKQSRVRPDTEGAGGERLGKHLASVPAEPDALPGSVGIADIDDLNQVVDFYGDTWWIAAEKGTAVNVGRVLYGAFHGPGGGDLTPPNSDDRRIHPLFTPMATKGNPDAGSGRIVNEQEARHFIRDSIPVVERKWRTQWEAILRRYQALIAKAIATDR